MRVTNTRQYMPHAIDGDQPEILWGTTAPDGDAWPQVDAPLGSVYFRKAASNARIYLKVAVAGADADWVPVAGDAQNTGFVPLSLAHLYEVSSNSIIGPLKVSGQTGRIGIPLESLRETDGTNIPNAAGNGGILASDTTPVLDYANGDTDSAFDLTWAASNQDAVAFQFMVPTDYDEASNMVLNIKAAMGGATDTPTIALDTYFGLGDTKVEDATGAVTGATPAVYTATIAAADIPASATIATIELTPGAHTTDALVVYEIYLTYTKEATPALATANGDTDSSWTVTWAAADVTPVVFQTALPPDLDTANNVVVHFRAKSGGATDTPTIASDAYFNEGDTKVEDVSAALGATYAEKTITIAAADVPTGAQTLTVELTPGTHGTDTVVLSSLWLEYTRL